MTTQNREGLSRSSDEDQGVSSRQTILSYSFKRLLLILWDPINILGTCLMGQRLWSQVTEEVREAIALCLLLQLPDLIGQLILQENFSSLIMCPKDIWSVNRYACIVIVTSDYLLWLTIGARILTRSIINIRSIFIDMKKNQ
ncbi:hypothetical protein DXZ20_19790 [Leptolyngbyaceae cyanobacterium CCMR0081]|uniref:Uncharacterized protein n=1 Tax=Adonisia turfae CCMR0081 TaxID=2292702 RepID=A0A6M0RNH4_9CYAN|nr:hypothetical protein [Adonisia turfae CCMR0081]